MFSSRANKIVIWNFKNCRSTLSGNPFKNRKIRLLTFCVKGLKLAILHKGWFSLTSLDQKLPCTGFQKLDENVQILFNFCICLINERNNKTNNINSEETSAKKTDQIAIGYSVTWDLILIGINGMREMAWIGPASFSI